MCRERKCIQDIIDRDPKQQFCILTADTVKITWINFRHYVDWTTPDTEEDIWLHLYEVLQKYKSNQWWHISPEWWLSECEGEEQVLTWEETFCR